MKTVAGVNEESQFVEMIRRINALAINILRLYDVSICGFQDNNVKFNIRSIKNKYKAGFPYLKTGLVLIYLPIINFISPLSTVIFT